MKTMIDDETLLRQFFAEQRQAVADNGFTERVMAVLPERDDAEFLLLRRWRWILDSLVALCVIILLASLTIHFWEGMQSGATRILGGSITLFHSMSSLMEPDNLLVRLILFLRNLLDWLPSPTQLLALFLTILVLLPITVKSALRHWAD